MKFFKKCPFTPYDPKTSDGCSYFPDGNWRACCLDHDMAYFYGGSAAAKRKADLALMTCVVESGNPYIAFIMFVGVRLFGGPAWPHRLRWGKGNHYCDSFTYAKQVQIHG